MRFSDELLTALARAALAHARSVAKGSSDEERAAAAEAEEAAKAAAKAELAKAGLAKVANPWRELSGLARALQDLVLDPRALLEGKRIQVGVFFALQNVLECEDPKALSAFVRSRYRTTKALRTAQYELGDPEVRFSPEGLEAILKGLRAKLEALRAEAEAAGASSSFSLLRERKEEIQRLEAVARDVEEIHKRISEKREQRREVRQHLTAPALTPEQAAEVMAALKGEKKTPKRKAEADAAPKKKRSRKKAAPPVELDAADSGDEPVVVTAEPATEEIPSSEPMKVTLGDLHPELAELAERLSADE